MDNYPYKMDIVRRMTMELLPLRTHLHDTSKLTLPVTVYTVGSEHQKPLTRLGGFSAHQLFFTVSGQGRFRSLYANPNEWDTLSAGSLLYIPAGCPHEYLPIGSRNWLVGYITWVEHYGQLLEHWGLGSEPRLYALSDTSWLESRITTLWKLLNGRHDPWKSTEILLGILLKFAKDHATAPGPKPESPAQPGGYPQSVVELAVRFLQDHMNRPLSTGQLARYVGYSPKQITRLFRKSTGRTPLQYLRDLRLQAARKLLSEHPELTITQIAAYVGLQPVYFTRLYKTAFGKLPSEDRG